MAKVMVKKRKKRKDKDKIIKSLQKEIKRFKKERVDFLHLIQELQIIYTNIKKDFLGLKKSINAIEMDTEQEDDHFFQMIDKLSTIVKKNGKN